MAIVRMVALLALSALPALLPALAGRATEASPPTPTFAAPAPTAQPERCDRVGAILLCAPTEKFRNEVLESQVRLQEHRASAAALAARWAQWYAEQQRRAEEERAARERATQSGSPVLAQLPSLPPQSIETAMAAAGIPDAWRAEFAAIAWCESRYRPDAVGDYGHSLGIWQLWRGWFERASVPIEYWADPISNARVALYVRQVRGRFGGIGGWTCADLLGIY